MGPSALLRSQQNFLRVGGEFASAELLPALRLRKVYQIGSSLSPRRIPQSREEAQKTPICLAEATS